MSIMKNNVLG